MRAHLAAISRNQIHAALPFLSALFAAVMIGCVSVPLALVLPSTEADASAYPPQSMTDTIRHLEVTARYRIADYPDVPLNVPRVGKDQSRFIDPSLARAIFPPARALTCDNCPIVPRVVKTIAIEKPVPKAKAKAKPKKRSDIASGTQLASVTGLDHEPPYEPAPVSAGWPRITPEQEASIAAARIEEDSTTTPHESWMRGEIDAYLCEVYNRLPVKKDNSGDFTWKDPAAAKRVDKTLCEYVIGGMSPDFREQLYAAGKKMDADGVKWSMLSAFRDDYRQKIASGFKASGGNSRHGGSRATKGYGDGQAIDIAAVAGTSIREVFAWLDKFGRGFGLIRPMPGYDPAHVQPIGGAWRALAAKLRLARTGESIEVTAAKRPQARVAKRVPQKRSRARQRYARR